MTVLLVLELNKIALTGVVGCDGTLQPSQITEFSTFIFVFIYSTSNIEFINPLPLRRALLAVLMSLALSGGPFASCCLNVCVGHKACAFPFPILSFVAVNRVTYVHISRSCHHFHGVNSVL